MVSVLVQYVNCVSFCICTFKPDCQIYVISSTKLVYYVRFQQLIVLTFMIQEHLATTHFFLMYTLHGHFSITMDEYI